MKTITTVLLAVAILLVAVGTAKAGETTADVAGYVYDSRGVPIRDAIVQFRFILKHQYHEGLISPTTLTDAEGKYHIEGLPVARGWAKATAPGRGYDAFEVKLDDGRLNIINFKL
jgi:hypothetical protein